MKKIFLLLCFAALAAADQFSGGGGSGGSGSVTSVASGCGLGGGPITVSGTLTRSEAVNAQTGTTYTVANGDCGKLITHNQAAAVAYTLPQAGSGGNFVAGWVVDIQNTGAGTITVTPTTSTIDGAATFTISQNQGARIVSDGTNYKTVRGIGGGSSPAGAGANLQYRVNSSTLGGVANLTSDGTNPLLSAIAAPATPSSGLGVFYLDSTSLNYAMKNANGIVEHGLVTSSCVNTVMTGINDAGVIACNTVTNAALAGSIATSKLASVQGTDTNLLTAGTVSGTAAPLCTDANGGATTTGCPAAGNGNAASEVNVNSGTFTATPTFTCPSATTSTVTHFTMPVLTGNITSSSIATCTPGQPIHIHFTQDGTGNRTFAAPTNFDACTLDPRPNAATDCNYDYDGTNGRLPGGHGTGYLLAKAPEISSTNANCTLTAPSGQAAMGFDATAHLPSYCENGGAWAQLLSNAAANTAAAGMTLDMSAATGATAFKVPVIAGATAGADGVIDYDSTGKITHIRTNGADSDAMASTATDTTTTHAVFATAVAGVYGARAIANGDVPAAAVPAVLTTVGSSRTIANNAEIIICTTTCTVTPPATGSTVAGMQFCAQNDDNVSTVITIAAVTSVQYENTARTSYKSAATAIASTGAIKDQICFVARDATHWNVFSATGTWN